MTRSPFAAAILASDATLTLRAALAVRGVLQDFAAVSPEREPATVDWAKALSVASALAGEDDATAQDVALRIAQGCFVANDALGIR